MTWLVDTNVISELCRREPDAAVLAWAATVSRYAISAISLEEVGFGLAWRPNQRVLAWMEGYFERHQIIPVSPVIARRAGELRGRLAAIGQVRHQADMLIAATAQAHQLILVTRNTRDFEHCGIGLFNPFGEA